MLLIFKIKLEIIIKFIFIVILLINLSNVKIIVYVSKDFFKICLLLKWNFNVCEIFVEFNVKYNF